jgi:hypothetical protein
VVVALAALIAALPTPISDRQLSLMPLPKSGIGPAGASLPLAQGSGVVTDQDAASDANGKVTELQLASLGRLTGYALSYGYNYAVTSGVEQVETSVELYRDAASASRGLAFWKRDETDLQDERGLRGFSVTLRPLAVPAVGDERFAFTGHASLAGFRPLYGTDELFRTGRLIVKVTVGAGSPGISERLAPQLAKKMSDRVRGILAGSLRAQLVPLGSAAAPGPPPHGPALDRVAISAADAGGGRVVSQGYEIDRDFSPVSEYRRQLQPAGRFASLETTVALMHSSQEASFLLNTVYAGITSPAFAKRFGVPGFKATTVQVTAGDESRAVVADVTLQGGRRAFEAFVLVRVGPLFETVVVGSPATFQPSSAADLARLAASKLRS